MEDGSTRYKELAEFISEKMRMSQIHRPLMLADLLTNRTQGLSSYLSPHRFISYLLRGVAFGERQ